MHRSHIVPALKRPFGLLFSLALLALLLGGSGTVLSSTSVSGLIVDSDTTTIRRPESYGKPHQTRIWYNPYADRWDALVPKDDGGGTSASDHYILLDVDGAQTFTGLELQDRDFSRSDIFWDAANKKLYALASHPTQSQFWRLGYDDVTDQYALEIGLPGTGIDVPGLSHPEVGNGGNSAATIGVSPNGAVWTAVMKDGTGLQVQYSADGGATWLAAPINLDATTRVGVTTWVTFKQGDAFYQGLFAGENGEGGSATEFFFWTIEATADPTVLANWSDESANIPAAFGNEQSDDHVSAAWDDAGNLYFAVKTEGGDPTDPLIKLYRRTPTGAWSQYKVTEVQALEELSRPSLVVDNDSKELYVFANGGEDVSLTDREAGYITAPLNALDTLATAPFVPLFSQPATIFTDIITPRDPVNGATSVVVLAHNRTEKNVWYSALTLGEALTVEAGADQRVFEHAVVTLDPATFTHSHPAQTHQSVIQWGDGTPPQPGHVDQNANTVSGSHVYTTPGHYDVTVTVSDDQGEMAADSFAVIVLPAFLDYCAYANDEDLKLEDDATTDCNLIGEAKVEIKEDAFVGGSVVSRDHDVVAKDGATIAGGVYAGDDAEIKKDVWVGEDVTAVDDVKVDDRSTVGGDVTAGGSVDIDRSARIVGTISAGASVPAFHPITPATFSVVAGNQDIVVQDGASLTLPPGIYGKLEVKDEATLNLSAGEYTFEKVTVKEDSIINVDLNGGMVVIRVEKDLKFEKRVQMHASGGDATDILFLIAGDDVRLEEDGHFLGTFLAPDADIEVKKEATLTGALYGAKVELDERVTLHGAPALDAFINIFMR